MTFNWGPDYVTVLKPNNLISWLEEDDKDKVESKVLTYEIPRLVSSEVIKLTDHPFHYTVRVAYYYQGKKHAGQYDIEEKLFIKEDGIQTIILHVAENLTKMMTKYLELTSDVSNVLHYRMRELGLQTHFEYHAPNVIYDIQGIPVPAVNVSTGVSRDSQYLPGVDSVVRHPITGDIGKLWNIIQDLNDHHKWSREKIADWIDELHDKGTIDASFGSDKIEVGPSKYNFSGAFATGGIVAIGKIVPLPVSFGVSGNSIDNKENNEDKE